MGLRERVLALLVGVAVYAYAGYPLLVWLAGRLRPRPVDRRPYEPSMTVIVPAHNEAAILPSKLDSILAQDYPADRLEVLVVSDGSTDATCEIARSYAERGVRLLDLPRGGKARGLNRAASEAGNDILVFTDANAILAPGALHALAANFADPQVGGVSANEKRLAGDGASATGLGERLYWEYDKWLKLAECRAGSMVSASGSMYAIRRELFRPIEDLAATDDFTISTQVVRRGRRLVFEPEAVTWEPPVTTSEMEFNRKVRIVTRGLRSVYGARDLLSPARSGFYALQLWSHKVIRRLVGFCAVGVFGLTLTLLGRRRIYRLMFAGQALLYGLALAGWLGHGRTWGRNKLLYIPYYFCLSNVATMLGVVQFFRQRRLEIWEPRRDP